MSAGTTQVMAIRVKELEAKLALAEKVIEATRGYLGRQKNCVHKDVYYCGLCDQRGALAIYDRRAAD